MNLFLIHTHTKLTHIQTYIKPAATGTLAAKGGGGGGGGDKNSCWRKAVALLLLLLLLSPPLVRVLGVVDEDEAWGCVVATVRGIIDVPTLGVKGGGDRAKVSTGLCWGGVVLGTLLMLLFSN